jgi:hypothetical protein
MVATFFNFTVFFRTYPFLSWCRGVVSINPDDAALSASIRKRSFSPGSKQCISSCSTNPDDAALSASIQKRSFSTGDIIVFVHAQLIRMMWHFSPASVI